MNTVKHVVKEVLSEPKKKTYNDTHPGGMGEFTIWRVKVKANSYGRIGTHTLTFDTKEQAEKVEPGYEFKA